TAGRVQAMTAEASGVELQPACEDRLRNDVVALVTLQEHREVRRHGLSFGSLVRKRFPGRSSLTSAGLTFQRQDPVNHFFHLLIAQFWMRRHRHVTPLSRAAFL